jgi:hypothetical protein
MGIVFNNELQGVMCLGKMLGQIGIAAALGGSKFAAKLRRKFDISVVQFGKSPCFWFCRNGR